MMEVDSLLALALTVVVDVSRVIATELVARVNVVDIDVDGTALYAAMLDVLK